MSKLSNIITIIVRIAFSYSYTSTGEHLFVYSVFTRCLYLWLGYTSSYQLRSSCAQKWLNWMGYHLQIQHFGQYSRDGQERWTEGCSKYSDILAQVICALTVWAIRVSSQSHFWWWIDQRHRLWLLLGYQDITFWMVDESVVWFICVCCSKAAVTPYRWV